MEFLYGEIEKEIAPEFVPPELWPEYGHIADPVNICKRELIREQPVAIRWSLWPLTFEQYWDNVEPDLARSDTGELARNRIVFWHRLHNSPIPRGWHRSGSIFRVDGYQILEDNNFTVNWHKNARRDLRMWKEKFEDKGYGIEEISDEEFTKAYKKSLISKREGNDRLYDLERKLAHTPTRSHIKLCGVRNSNKDIIAGIAVIFSPTYKSSTHFAPFIHEEARHVYASTALINHWFEESLRRDFNVVMTLNFWHKGKPKSWKGFSEFKSHFGFRYVTYPPILWRFRSGKLW